MIGILVLILVNISMQGKKSKSNYHIKPKKKQSGSLLSSPWKQSGGGGKASFPSASSNSLKEIPMLNVFLHRLNQHNGNGGGNASRAARDEAGKQQLDN